MYTPTQAVPVALGSLEFPQAVQVTTESTYAQVVQSAILPGQSETRGRRTNYDIMLQVGLMPLPLMYICIRFVSSSDLIEFSGF